MQKTKHAHFKSRIFMRLFFTYVIIIVLFIAAYAGYFITRSRASYREGVRQESVQRVIALRNAMDVQLMGAQHIVGAINSSETFRTLYQRIAVENTPVETMLFYRAQAEIKRIKASSNNLNIYNVMLNFIGDPRAFTASSVINFEAETAALPRTPSLMDTTVSALWDVKDSSHIQINKEYIIYGDVYNGALNSAAKGSVLVLFEKIQLQALLREALDDRSGVRVLYRGEPVLSGGVGEGVLFEEVSTLHTGLSFALYVEEGAFVQPFTSAGFVPLFVALAIGLAFLVLTYFVSKHYYSPFDSIGRIIGPGEDADRGEVEGIIAGIRSLIGERNGYREKVVTITPYARQGLLHGIVTGNVRRDRLQILIDEEFVDLKMPCFMVALANIAYLGPEEIAPIRYQDMAEVLLHLCQALSEEDLQIVCYAKDARNVFVIANGNGEGGLSDVFFTLHQQFAREVEEEDFVLTVGVGRLEDDLGRLRAACQDAQEALAHMLVGGRNAVYVHEPASPGDAPGYVFPRDAQKRLVKGFKEGNLADLQAFLDELYAANIQNADIPPAAVSMMVEELHLATRNAVKAVSPANTTHIQIASIQEAATIDEIFRYYAAIFETICGQLGELVAPENSVRKLKDEIVAYIDGSFLDPDLSLNGVADRFGVSTKYILLVCKEQLGATFLQYVREKQVRHAAELLRGTDASMEEIAARCGFSNMLTFRRNFKAVMKMNPSDYRP